MAAPGSPSRPGLTGISLARRPDRHPGARNGGFTRVRKLQLFAATCALCAAGLSAAADHATAAGAERSSARRAPRRPLRALDRGPPLRVRYRELFAAARKLDVGPRTTCSPKPWSAARAESAIEDSAERIEKARQRRARVRPRRRRFAVDARCDRGLRVGRRPDRGQCRRLLRQVPVRHRYLGRRRRFAAIPPRPPRPSRTTVPRCCTAAPAQPLARLRFVTP